MTDRAASLPLDLVSEPDSTPPGVRLDAVEILNWGTFDRQVWRLDLGGDNALLTGDIGSGKSTLVDAITTPAGAGPKIAYNKAAGADMRERTCAPTCSVTTSRSAARRAAAAGPWRSRDHNNYSVILGRFRNEGYGETVTLAQIFWFKEATASRHGSMSSRTRRCRSPSTSLVSAATSTHCARRLRTAGAVELFDTFPPYGAGFRRRFGIDSEQALELFHQTVSMKSVGNLTDFVRAPHAGAVPRRGRIEALVAPLRGSDTARTRPCSRRGADRALVPIVADCDGHAALVAEVEEAAACREALRAFFARAQAGAADAAHRRLDLDIAKLGERHRGAQGPPGADSDAAARWLEAGDRGERRRPDGVLGREIDAEAAARQRAQAARGDAMPQIASKLGLAAPRDADEFLATGVAIEERHWHRPLARAGRDAERAGRKPASSSARLKTARRARRRARIARGRGAPTSPPRMLAMRGPVRALGLDADELPFAGELIQVRRGGARMGGRGRALLPASGCRCWCRTSTTRRVASGSSGRTSAVAWSTTACRSARDRARPSPRPGRWCASSPSRPNRRSTLAASASSAQRFDYACCDDARRSSGASARRSRVPGRSRRGGERHEKDDRHRIDDRCRYVLGWSNGQRSPRSRRRPRELRGPHAGARQRIAALATAIAAAAQTRIGLLQQLCGLRQLPRARLAAAAPEIDGCKNERRQLETASDVLQDAAAQLACVAQAIADARSGSSGHRDLKLDERPRRSASRHAAPPRADVAARRPATAARFFPQLEALRHRGARRAPAHGGVVRQPRAGHARAGCRRGSTPRDHKLDACATRSSRR